MRLPGPDVRDTFGGMLLFTPRLKASTFLIRSLNVLYKTETLNRLLPAAKTESHIRLYAVCPMNIDAN